MPELRELYQGQPALTKMEGVLKAYSKNHVGIHANRKLGIHFNKVGCDPVNQFRAFNLTRGKF